MECLSSVFTRPSLSRSLSIWNLASSVILPPSCSLFLTVTVQPTVLSVNCAHRPTQNATSLGDVTERTIVTSTTQDAQMCSYVV